MAVEPRRPPMRNVGTETALRQTRPLQAFPKKVNIRSPASLGVRGQLMPSPACTDPKEKYSPGSEFTPEQADFEVDRPPPADSPPGDLLIIIIKETAIIYKIVLKK